MPGYTYWDSVVDRLEEIERNWKPPSPGGNVTTTAHRGPQLGFGIQSTTSACGGTWVGGILCAMPGASAYHNAVRRVNNVTRAINQSFPAAYGEIEKRLGGISVASIEDVLYNMLRDVAITLGGSTALGAGIGGAAGAFAFGVGAVPGAAVGSAAGFELGSLILTFTGLKSIVSYMKNAVPAAVTCYGDGFRKAWGNREDEAPFANWAYRDFAMGHVLFFLAILMGIIGYLTRGKGNFPMLLGEIRASAKLGPKFADWISANKDALIRNPALQQGVKASAGGAAESEAPAVVSEGPIRGQRLPNVIDPNASRAAPSPAATSATPQSSRPWLDRMRQGNEFDDARAPSYPYNEIYVDKPGGGYTRLDSYDPDTGEIVSRKLTQLSEVQEQTAVNYVNEIPSKYPVGSTIANVPSSGNLAGETLSGQYILEVPPQTNPVPQSVLNAASQAGVTIRDTAGVTYP